MVGRVVLNAPREMPPPHRRPSWDSWIRPSLTYARPSPVRVKSVIRPWCARVASAALCFTFTICRLWLFPVSRRARTPHEPTQDERHTGSDRTQNEQPTNTDAPARQAALSTPPTVNRPFAARISSVSCLCAVRQESVLCPCAARV